MITVELRKQEGKILLGRARQHWIVTDRPADEGGRDLGCTSGELMLLAVGSCVMGNLSSYVEHRALPIEVLLANVFVDPASTPEGFGRVVVAAQVKGVVAPAELSALTEAVGAGRVVRRMRQGTEVDIRVMVCAENQSNRRLRQGASGTLGTRFGEGTETMCR